MSKANNPHFQCLKVNVSRGQNNDYPSLWGGSPNERYVQDDVKRTAALGKQDDDIVQYVILHACYTYICAYNELLCML